MSPAQQAAAAREVAIQEVLKQNQALLAGKRRAEHLLALAAAGVLVASMVAASAFLVARRAEARCQAPAQEEQPADWQPLGPLLFSMNDIDGESAP